jgi:hypothetical protein
LCNHCNPFKNEITNELQQLETEEEAIIDENDIAEEIDIPEVKDNSVHVFSEHTGIIVVTFYSS